MSFCYAIFFDIPYFRSYDLIAKPNGAYVTAVKNNSPSKYGSDVTHHPLWRIKSHDGHAMQRLKANLYGGKGGGHMRIHAWFLNVHSCVYIRLRASPCVRVSVCVVCVCVCVCGVYVCVEVSPTTRVPSLRV